ncbi:MAG: hypothetical protein N2D54_13255, partial [Chloroflexota bacterium]
RLNYGDESASEELCKICVSKNFAIKGNYGMKLRVVNKLPHFLQDNSPKAENRYRARFYIKIGDMSLGHLDKFTLLEGRQGSISPFNLEVRKNGTNFQIRAGIRNDSGNWKYTNWILLPKNVTRIEIDWKAAKNAVFNNGYIKLFIDGELKRTKNKINNDKIKITGVRLGITKPLGTSVNAAGVIFLDSFASNKQYSIGK